MSISYVSMNKVDLVIARFSIWNRNYFLIMILGILTYFFQQKRKTLKVKKCNRKFDSLFALKPPIKVNNLPSRFKEFLTITEISENINQDSLNNTIHNSNALFFNKLV